VSYLGSGQPSKNKTSGTQSKDQKKKRLKKNVHEDLQKRPSNRKIALGASALKNIKGAMLEGTHACCEMSADNCNKMISFTLWKNN